MVEDRLSRVTIRPLAIETDVDLLYAWLGDPDVQRWYSEGEHSLEHYRRHFGPEPGIHRFITEIDGNPVGYIQAYRLADEEEYADQIGLDGEVVSLDMLIGDADWRGSGWGAVVLHATLDQIVFGQMQAKTACMNPDPENERAVKAYEKAGFRGDRVVWVESDEPHDTGYERIMVLNRDDFYRRG